jgi:hypothetical protein
MFLTFQIPQQIADISNIWNFDQKIFILRVSFDLQIHFLCEPDRFLSRCWYKNLEVKIPLGEKPHLTSSQAKLTRTSAALPLRQAWFEDDRGWSGVEANVWASPWHHLHPALQPRTSPCLLRPDLFEIIKKQLSHLYLFFSISVKGSAISWFLVEVPASCQGKKGVSLAICHAGVFS